MGLFDNAINCGRCPACGQQTRQTVRWFRAMRQAVAQAALDAAVAGDDLGEAERDKRGQDRGDQDGKSG